MKMAEKSESQPQQNRSKQLLYVDPQPDAPFLVANSRQKPTFAPMGRSSALDRVRAFLPELKKANEELEQTIATQGPDAVNIERVDDSAPHIEMNLGWMSDSSDEDGEDQLGSSDNEQDADESQVALNGTLKTRPSSRKPKIEVMDT